MAKVPSIPQELNELYTAQWLRQEAKNHGVVQRFVKVDIVVFFWALVLAPAAGVVSSLADLQRIFQAMSGFTLAPSAFQKRFCKKLVPFLAACAQRAFAVQLEAIATPEIFRRFREVLAIDSTLVALADVLAVVFPGPRTNTCPAAVKVNAVYSVLSASVRQVTIAKGTKAEKKLLKLGRDVAGTLLLMDLGYFAYAVFGKINRNKGYFISRMKKNANPRIIADRHAGPGRKRNLVGLKLWNAIKGLARDLLDVDVEITYREPRRPTRKDRRKTVQRKVRMRAVGVRHPETGELHLYLTNVPCAWMTPEQIRTAYSARWIVELAFDWLKHGCGMEAFPSKRPEVVKALIYAALIRLAVSRTAMESLCGRVLSAGQEAGGEPMRQVLAQTLKHRGSHKRFLKAWNCYSLLLLPEVLKEAGITWDIDKLELLLFSAMLDPNKNRDTLSRRLADA